MLSLRGYVVVASFYWKCYALTWRGSRHVSLVVVAIVVAAVGLSAEAERGGWFTLMERGRESESRFEFEAAAKQYDLAHWHARSTLERVESSVALADLLVRYSKEGFVEPSRFETIRASRKRAIRLYEQALDRIEGEAVVNAELRQLEVHAVNNLSVVLIQEGHERKAIRLLEEGLKKVDPVARAHFLLNFATACERLKSKRGLGVNPKEKAFDLYLEAGSSEEGLPVALDRAANLLLKEPELQPSRASGFLESLVARGEYRLAVRTFKELFAAEWCAGASQCDAVAVPFVRYLVAVGLTPTGFKEEWEPYLPLSSWREEVALALEGSLPATLREQQARALFPTWAEPPVARKSFADFLRAVADTYFRQDKRPEALARYSLAWALDSTNHDSAIYLLNLLAIEPEKLDPRGDLLWAALARGPALSTTADVDRGRGQFYLLAGDAFHSRQLALGEQEASAVSLLLWEAARQRFEAEEGPTPFDLVGPVEAKLASIRGEIDEGDPSVAAILSSLDQPGELESDLQRSAANVVISRVPPGIEDGFIYIKNFQWYFQERLLLLDAPEFESPMREGGYEVFVDGLRELNSHPVPNSRQGP